MMSFLILTSIAFTAALVPKVNLIHRTGKLLATTTDYMNSKGELLKHCRGVKIGDPFPETAADSIRKCVEEIESHSSHERLTHSLQHFDGEWLMLYSTLPAFFKRIALRDLSAGTIPSEEPLILVNCVKQVVKLKPSGIYQYDNLVEFHGSREHSTEAPIAGLHITRGTAELNGAESADKTVRFNVAFYENEATSASKAKADADDMKKLFGFKPDDQLLGKYPAAFKSWSDIVYLDEDLRIMRGGKGNIYILTKVAE